MTHCDICSGNRRTCLTSGKIPAGFATVCGLDDACISQGSSERSLPVEPASRLRTSDAHLNLLTVNALHLSHEFADLIREGYSQDSFYGDEGEWTKDSRIEARDGFFGVSIAYVFHRTLSSD
jgi:hypothetical protein